MAARGLKVDDLMRLSGSHLDAHEHWLLPPLTGRAPGPDGFGPRQAYYKLKADRLTPEQALQSLSAYRHFIRAENPGLAILLHFEELPGEPLGRVYFTPCTSWAVERGWPPAALMAIQAAQYLVDLHGAHLVQSDNSYYAKAFGSNVGVVNGTVAGLEVTELVLPGLLNDMLTQPIPLPWSGVSTSPVRLRNLMNTVYTDQGMLEFHDDVLALYGALSREPYLGAYAEINCKVGWETRCRLHDAEVVSYWQGLFFSPVKAVKKVTKEDALTEKRKLVEMARELVLSDDVKDLQKIHALKAMMCPEVLPEKAFWRKVLGMNAPRSGATPALDQAKSVALLHMLQVEIERDLFILQHRKSK